MFIQICRQLNGNCVKMIKLTIIYVLTWIHLHSKQLHLWIGWRLLQKTPFLNILT